MHGQISFEDLKKINEYGAEYWSARELQPLLGYSQWRVLLIWQADGNLQGRRYP